MSEVINSGHKIIAEKLNETLQKSGLLVHKEGSGHLDFEFVYLGYPFSVRAQSSDNLTSIVIRTVLGNLPYSAESRQARLAVVRILSAINRKLNFNLSLAKNQRLILSGEVINDESLSPANLLTMVSTVLLQSRPYLELISEYVTPSGESVEPLPGRFDEADKATEITEFDQALAS